MARNQEGGHSFCPNCDIDYTQTDDISHCDQLYLTHKKVIAGKYEKENSIQGKVRAFMSLKKEELMQELSFGFIKYPENTTKSNTQIILKKALKGTVRVPILKKNYPVHVFEIFNLEQYEVALIEPMYEFWRAHQ